jgi:hypothetical protein
MGAGASVQPVSTAHTELNTLIDRLQYNQINDLISELGIAGGRNIYSNADAKENVSMLTEEQAKDTLNRLKELKLAYGIAGGRRLRSRRQSRRKTASLRRMSKHRRHSSKSRSNRK